ncbi:LysR family transcriptional regulator [Mangrovibrevibacter kandeliae]|uniref:LysR family transcriptional regulator n=1 Tax=Mangrovibrevibacter kandeliae TaxID=2968473 RepID=UPI0021197C50|nr:LysR family transcriptional regulator [Aurantimonas sp. CSK15Z-1]MCQ8783639.1 LysR family transcriptional regulator [Aurantimonas sp. CSK15Z-1]
MPFDGRVLSGIAVLAAAVERGSFTRAGETLGLSASGVSRAVARLESRVGVRLLDRTTRSLRLTSEGARLYDLAAPHLAGLEAAADAASEAAQDVRGHLRASVNPIFARHILAGRLGEFATRHPSLRLTLVQQPDVGDLVAEGVDVAIRFGPQIQPGLSVRLLLETRVLTVASPAYLARRGRPEAPAELAGHECLQFVDPRTGRPFEWEFRRATETVPVPIAGALTLGDVDTMVAACLAGAGVAQVLALGVERHLASGALVDLFPDWPGETYPLFAVRPARRLAPARVTTFIDFCAEIAEPPRRSSQQISAR